MRVSSPDLTPQRVELLQELDHDGDAGLTKPLHMDDLTALAKLDLIWLDPNAQVRLTDKGRRVVADKAH